MNIKEKLIKAEKIGIEDCDYCKYRSECNHFSVSNYGNNPSYTTCSNGGIEWVDEDELDSIFEDMEDK